MAGCEKKQNEWMTELEQVPADLSRRSEGYDWAVVVVREDGNGGKCRSTPLTPI